MKNKEKHSANILMIILVLLVVLVLIGGVALFAIKGMAHFADKGRNSGVKAGAGEIICTVFVTGELFEVVENGVYDLVRGISGAEASTNVAYAEEEAAIEAAEEYTVEEEVEVQVGLSGKLTVWTLAADLEMFADRFAEMNPEVEMEVVVIAPADYPTKVEVALLGGDSEPDIIVGEPYMLQSMYDAGFFADLNAFGAGDYEGEIVDYVWQVGQDDDGVQRTISYQITPTGVFYRRDIADKVFGTSDPSEISRLFADYDTILETANTLKASGYRIFASDAEMNYFTGDSAWVIDGKLNVDHERSDYMDLRVALYQSDLTANAPQWTAPWYMAMSGSTPVVPKEYMWGDWGTDASGDTLLNVWDADNFEKNAWNYTNKSAEVFAYCLPSWGKLTLRDNMLATEGLWGVAAGPSYGYGGGTYIGISELSNDKELAWEFVKFCTLNENTAEWWLSVSGGDVVSYISVLEKHAYDSDKMFGGQNLYGFWLERAQGIDYSKVTQYDTAINDAWERAVTSNKEGYMTKKEAVNEFYEEVAATYPDLIIER